jgi:hypothetical protein
MRRFKCESLRHTTNNEHEVVLSMCEAEGKSLCMIHLQHDDTVAMSQQEVS